MSGQKIIISNNPRIFALNLPEWERIELSSGTAREVIEAARDRIHFGWRLVHHPLYGNFRPHQQPFRTIILEKTAPEGKHARMSKSAGGGPEAHTVPATDVYSLKLIEEALGIYQSQKVLRPEDAPTRLFNDCSMLDFELMRVTLSQSGWAE